MGDLGKDAGGERGKFRRFMDHGAACGEGGRDLPRREHKGRVPRRDDADGADGHAGGDVHQRGRGQHLAIAGRERTVGKETKVLGTAQGGLGHEAQRLTGVPALAERDFLGAGNDAIGDAVQDRLAFTRRQVAPSGEGGFGGLCGGINVVCATAGNRADHAFVDR